MLVLMFCGLALAGFVIHALEFLDLENRVDDGLDSKSSQIQKLAKITSDFSPESVSEHLRDAANEVDLSKREFVAAIIDGQIAWRVDGDPKKGQLLADGGGGDDRYAHAAALASPARTVSADLAGDAPVRVMVGPLSGPARSSGVLLMIGRDTSNQRAPIMSSIQTYSLVSAGTLVAAAAAGTLIAGRMLGPLRRLQEATEIVSQHDLSKRVAVRKSADDVTQLATTFNTMLERLDQGAREQHQFMDDAGHELRTPLTILRGHLELMAADDPVEVAATRDLLLEEVDRMQRLVDDLLLLANARQPDFVRKEPIGILDFTHHVMDKIRVLGVRRWQIDEVVDTIVMADPQRLTQAMVQLAANAVKYTDSSSVIALGARLEHSALPAAGRRPGRDTLALWVRDSGVGIAPQDQRRIFQRFGRVGSGRGEDGAGLGLAIVSAIAEAHAGHITLESAQGRGSTFSIRIPVADGRLPR
ncbi:sensor histidine kinase [Pseudarthrobacter sp. P1]|uniref:sensor histidine kinase n=1 Tax=Pseudarthrobacter sp. P1 TaxID=3418418 RepID=UPI003CE9CBA3